MSDGLDEELAVKSAADFTPYRIRDRALDQALWLCGKGHEDGLDDDAEERAKVTVAVARLFEAYLQGN